MKNQKNRKKKGRQNLAQRQHFVTIVEPCRPRHLTFLKSSALVNWKIQLLYDGRGIKEMQNPKGVWTVLCFYQSTKNFLARNRVSNTLNFSSWLPTLPALVRGHQVLLTLSLQHSLTEQHLVPTPKDTVTSTRFHSMLS